jgi:hypothetical protein
MPANGFLKMRSADGIKPGGDGGATDSGRV